MVAGLRLGGHGHPGDAEPVGQPLEQLHSPRLPLDRDDRSASASASPSAPRNVIAGWNEPHDTPWAPRGSSRAAGIAPAQCATAAGRGPGARASRSATPAIASSGTAISHRSAGTAGGSAETAIGIPVASPRRSGRSSRGFQAPVSVIPRSRASRRIARPTRPVP